MRTGLTMVAGAMLATAAVAQQPPATTVQQDFVAAIALDEAANYTGALAAWTALEAKTKPGSRSRAIVMARKADSLYRLFRYDEAAAAAKASLAGLPVDDATLRDDLRRTWFIVGTIAASTLDYAGAVPAFAKAETFADTPGGKLGPLLALVDAQTFVDPAAATASLARAETVLASANFDADTRGFVGRRRTVLLLNTGDLAGAKTSAMATVKALGGLTEKTSGLDAQARSDAALTLILNGQPDSAREYMAMTGAGRLAKGRFDPGAQMQSPDCGGEAGLKPSDVAAVEFNIAPEGRVTGVAPIYAAGGGRVALEFARAVQGWSWSPAEMAEIPAFFRSNVRVEMRCSTTFERPSIGDGLDAGLEQWLTEKRVAVPAAPGGGDAQALPAQRAALTTAESGGPTSLATLAALYRLANNRAVGREERAKLYARAFTIAVTNDAPVEPRLALDLPARTEALVDRWKPEAYRRAVQPMLSEAPYAADPQARAAIRLTLADDARPGRATDAQTLVLLRQVADDAALKPNDPLRVGALVRIASIEERNGRADVARASFASSGLTADQCAILDAPPKMLRSAGAEAFPMEALRWGFEGWTLVQFDIAADGSTKATRTLLSYPPFIFSKAGSDLIVGAKFAKTYRPDGGLGCGGSTRRIVFGLPK